jgi:AraC-like DNA-binding protein
MRTGRIYGVFSIYFSPAYLDNWIHHYPALNDFIIKVFNNEPAILCDTDQITSLEMDVIIKQLIQNTFSGMARSIYMDLKIKELFMLVFDKVSNHPTVGHTCLSKNEIERFTEARDVLLQNIQNPMSLKQLSRKFGLNTKKIKNGFKQLYERTPFDLLLSTRMDKAKKMLTNSSMSITEIADEIGYDNKHSFSKAFKKYFGYPPGRFRKIDEESFCKYSTLDN